MFCVWWPFHSKKTNHNIQKFEGAVVTTRKHSESVKRNTRTCFLSPHPPSLELQCRLRLKVRAMRLSRAALEKAIPSAAIFAFFFVFCALEFLGSKAWSSRGRGGKSSRACILRCTHARRFPHSRTSRDDRNDAISNVNTCCDRISLR